MANKVFMKSDFHVYESSKLTFHGVEGYDVYNCSIPFTFGKKEYIFGRVEKREVWADSWIYLFEKIGPDTYSVTPDSRSYQLEDPYIAIIDGEFILGGTHVVKSKGQLCGYYGYFYKGKDPRDLTYFTTGPDFMKDIRLVPLANGRIGVFSRPRGTGILKQYGSESMIGFTSVGSIMELDAKVISEASYIYGIFEDGEWGGCNQAYLLESGKIGVIGHLSSRYQDDRGIEILCYRNISFVFDPETFEVTDPKIIADRSCYPVGPAKDPSLVDCAFTSGIVIKEDGKAELYSGISDTEEGRIVIDNPFTEKILSSFDF